jgi:hypothetical protein
MSKHKAPSAFATAYRFSLLGSLASLLCVMFLALSYLGFIPGRGDGLVGIALSAAALVSIMLAVNAIWINRLGWQTTTFLEQSGVGLEHAKASIESLAVKAQALEQALEEKGGQLSARLNSADESIDALYESMAVGRLADVEHIAISAALMAASPAVQSQSVHLPASQHGHALLIRELFVDSANNEILPPEANVHLLEIGTTRERWWPQMSTHRLASVCRALHLKMLTVDVDPVGVDAVQDIEAHYPDVVTAATERGEVLLENWEGALPPYIYLDGYDFDHPGHSQERQERYLELQGKKISDESCWEMHRRCAVAFIEKCSRGGKVVFDDAFYDGKHWSGKGKTAIPLMLDNGFEIVSATQATVLLQKT